MTDDELAAIRARAKPGRVVDIGLTLRDEAKAWHVLYLESGEDARTLLAEVERLQAREAQWRAVVQAVASLWVMDDCSNGNDFPQRRISLYDRTDDGVPVTDVAEVREKARALLAGNDN